MGLARCNGCRGFVTRAAGSCPNCGAKVIPNSLTLGVLGAIGSGALAVTLMACYGCPDCADNPSKYCPADMIVVAEDASCPDVGAPDSNRADVSVADAGGTDSSAIDGSSEAGKDGGTDAKADGSTDADTDGG